VLHVWQASYRCNIADPATWMLDISTISAEQRLGVDLADCYADSSLAR
jgi:hypothetical protein